MVRIGPDWGVTRDWTEKIGSFRSGPGCVKRLIQDRTKMTQFFQSGPVRSYNKKMLRKRFFYNNIFKKTFLQRFFIKLIKKMLRKRFFL